MYGMQLMSGAVSPLADMPQFTHLLTAFDNPFIGVAVGALFTGIIQSSAASVGVLQALSMTGSITYDMAIPIIMGQNIGTCVTALLSSIGVNRNARRVSIIHISFNLIGTFIGLIVYFVLNYGVEMALLTQPITPFAIAVCHTIFNVATTILLLPFSRRLVQIANFVIKDDSEHAPEKIILDERLLISPGLAVAKCREQTAIMGGMANAAFSQSLALFNETDRKILRATMEDIRNKEDRLDHMEDALNSYLIKLSNRDVTDDVNNEISELMHTTGDFERISDHAVNMVILMEEMQDRKMAFSDEARKEIALLSDAMNEILTITLKCFEARDRHAARQVEPLEEIIDQLTADIKERHIYRLRAGTCSGEMGVIMTDYLTNCERVSDHCSNIAVCLNQTRKSTFGTHAYLHDLKYENDTDFEESLNYYREKYRLSPQESIGM